MKPWLNAILATMLLAVGTVHAGREETEAAVAETLFELEMENVSYAIKAAGDLHITFGAAVSAADYADAVRRLKAHPHIPAVIAGRGSTNFCPLP